MIRAAVLAVLLAPAAQESEYDARVRELNEAVVAQRRKAAATLEKLKAWAWARAEWRKVLRVYPHDEEAQGKLSGSTALPIANQETDSATAERYGSLLAETAKVAAPGHVALAKWCAERGKTAAAKRHWELALLFDPINAEAVAALGFSGSGAAAVDPLWKDGWKGLLSKADAGKVVEEETELEKKWRERHAKRASPTFAWEGVDVPADHLKKLAQLAEAEVLLMRAALGDAEVRPCVKRMIIMTGKSNYHQYLDDFVQADAETMKLLKKTGGMENLAREEFAQFGLERGTDWHDSNVAHAAAEFMLAGALGLKDYDAPPAWLKEGVGFLGESLLRGTMRASCVSIPSGTGSGDVPWTESGRLNASVATLIARGRDPELADLAGVTLNAMKSAHQAKAVSVVRFLVLRWPELFRAVVAAVKKQPKDPRVALESALGLSLEEFDEFWRRWVRAQ